MSPHPCKILPLAFFTLFAALVTLSLAQCHLNSVCFALDQSGSLDSTRYEQIQNFTASTARALQTRSTVQLNLSAVAFSTDAAFIVRPTLNLETVFIPAIRAERRFKFFTNIFAGVALCSDALSGAPGKRSIILVTDGRHSEGGVDPLPRIKSSGVSVVTVGVGRFIDANFLRAAPTAQQFFIETTFATLLTRAAGVAAAACDAAGAPLPTPSAAPGLTARKGLESTPAFAPPLTFSPPTPPPGFVPRPTPGVVAPPPVTGAPSASPTSSDSTTLSMTPTSSAIPMPSGSPSASATSVASAAPSNSGAPSPSKTPRPSTSATVTPTLAILSGVELPNLRIVTATPAAVTEIPSETPSPTLPSFETITPPPSNPPRVPTTFTPAPSDPAPVSGTISPAPSASSPMSESVTPPPVEPALVSGTITPAPSESAPVSGTISPAPSEPAPVSETITPAPSESAPVSVSVSPAPSESAPVPSTITSAPSISAPVSTTITPAPSESGPVSGTITPVPSESAPVSTTKTPAPSPSASPLSASSVEATEPPISTTPPLPSGTPPANTAACLAAFAGCEFNFNNATSLQTFEVGSERDTAFSGALTLKKGPFQAGTADAGTTVPELITATGPQSITRFGSPNFGSSSFKPYYIAEGRSGIGHETLQGDQIVQVRGRCVRIFFSRFQLFDARGHVVANVQTGGRKAGKCVVFRTAA